MIEDEIRSWRPGVLNNYQLKRLVDDQKVLRNVVNPKDAIDGSAIDLTISEDCFVMQGCIKPHKEITVEDVISSYKHPELKVEPDREGNITLNTNTTYIFKLNESLYLKKDYCLSGRATGKSSIGRLDVLVRLLAHGSNSYDSIEGEHQGALYIEVTPITFQVKVKPGISLNQLRLFKGKPHELKIDRHQLDYWGNLLLNNQGQHIPLSTLQDIQLSLSLEPVRIGNNRKAIAYYTKDQSELNGKIIDLTKGKGANDPKEYWKIQELEENPKNPSMIELEAEKFYILRSKERFVLPKSVCVYCQAVAENLGEIRIHYAGFAHPNFGKERQDQIGAPLIFEVRCHNVKTFLQDNEALAILEYYPMSENVVDDLFGKKKEGVKAEKGSGYSQQELTLSNYFADWV